jgi:predicted RNA-binding Zn-ribbon protein involved in translation (DUF1610 family)
MSARRAQLIAEAVAVVCPACGEVQPAYGGSEFWTHEDFARVTKVRPCVSCDVPLIIQTDSKVVFR